MLINRFIAQNIGIPLFDYVKKLKVNEYYNVYQAALDWDRRHIEEYQLQKLKRLVNHAYNSVLYYKKQLEKHNVTPSAIQTLEDFKKIPPLTREDLQKNIDILLAKDVNKRNLYKSSSSGTTGIPIVYYKDTNGYSADIAATYVLWYMWGCYIGDKRLHIWGNPHSIKHWNTKSSKLKSMFLNYKNFPSFLLNKRENYPNIVRLINIWKPDYIEGYTNFIYMIARYIRDNNITINRPKRVFTTAENLYDYQRQIIEQTVAPVTDFYGCGEVNGVAIQCMAHKYHIFEPRAFVEAVQGASKSKQILLTDLENLAMPLIRYEVGDLFDGIHDDSDCTCGSKFKYFNTIEGRTAELITLPNGTIISPVSILGGTAFRKIHNIKRHQTIWNGKYIIFNFEINNDFSHHDEKKLELTIEDVLRDYDVAFKLVTTREMIKTENKFSYFKIDYEAH